MLWRADTIKYSVGRLWLAPRQPISGETSLSWCDKLAATPAIGLKLSPHYVAGDAIVNALTPWFDKWATPEKAPIVVTRHESFAFAFTLEEGLQFAVEPMRTFVDFSHRIRMRTVSGGPPVAEMLSHPLPYTSLLPDLGKRLMELTMDIPSLPDRTFNRIGIVAKASIAPDDAPPGITRFLDYLGRPWKGLVGGYSFQVTGAIGNTTEFADRCVHTLTKPETGENAQLLSLNFDWQRTFEVGQPLKREILGSALASAEKAALSYFEDLAEGNRFDADLD